MAEEHWKYTESVSQIVECQVPNARVIVNALQRAREGLPVTGRVEGAAVNYEHPVALHNRILRHFSTDPESSTRIAMINNL